MTVAGAIALASAFGSGDAEAAAGASIAVGDVAAPPPSAGIGAEVLRSTAEGEISQLDASRLPARRVVVALAVTKASDAPVTCAVNATLLDAKSGAMIAIVQGEAHSESAKSSDLKKQVANAAIRSAVRQIPAALAER